MAIGSSLCRYGYWVWLGSIWLFRLAWGRYGYLVCLGTMWLFGLTWVDMAVYLVWHGSIWLFGLAWVDMAIWSGLARYGSRSFLVQNG